MLPKNERGPTLLTLECFLTLLPHMALLNTSNFDGAHLENRLSRMAKWALPITLAMASTQKFPRSKQSLNASRSSSCNQIKCSFTHLKFLFPAPSTRATSGEDHVEKASFFTTHLQSLSIIDDEALWQDSSPTMGHSVLSQRCQANHPLRSLQGSRDRRERCQGPVGASIKNPAVKG